MKDLLLVIGAILLWIGGWLIGRASAFKAVRKQEEEFQRVRDSLHVPPPPPLTEEEEELIRRAREVKQ